jgi:trk system potassium uptake protein TrkA
MTQPANQHQYFIIGGGGRVGYFLARSLLAADHEVVLLEKDPRRVADLNRELGDVVERGDACEVITLDRVGAVRADYLLAVTGEDEDNLVMCQVAQTGFTRKPGKICRTIARVNNIANILLFERLGIDVVVSPTQNILDAIGTEIPLPRVAHLSPSSNTGDVHLVEVRVAADAPARDKPLAALGLQKPNEVVLLIRGTQNYTPVAAFTLQAGDKLFAIVNDAGQQILQRSLLGGQG